MAIYIKGIGNISIQDTLGKNEIETPISYSKPHIHCIEANYKAYFSPLKLRRMSSIIKRAITSALVAIQDAKIEKLDAIISGTGLGCIEDTEHFLLSMIENEEQFLQPTHFIQSTHNTISAQIAIQLQCHAYNNTFTHRGISFEMALWDTYLLFANGKIDSALIGGYDELTPNYFQQLKKLGYWKEEIEDSLHIIQTGGQGSFAGEGSISFVLTTNPEHAYARIDAMQILYNPSDDDEIATFIHDFLNEQHVSPQEIDVLFVGKNGDDNNDEVYSRIANRLFPSTPQAIYKNLCGEFFTATAFGLWSAATCLKNNKIPICQQINHCPTDNISTILLYNHFQNKHHSLILISV